MATQPTSRRFRRFHPFMFIPVVALLLACFAMQTPPTGYAETAGSPALDTSDPTETPIPTATETVPPTADLTGIVSIRPEYSTNQASRRPIRYVVVLDVSGSMNYSFDGRGKQGDEIRQCGNSPDPERDTQRETCLPNQNWAWEPLEERRIYVAREAISHLIGLINIPGNDGYNSMFPADQMRLVTFNQRVNATSAWSSNKDTLHSVARTIGQSGMYTTYGGTNGAAGLYQAAQFLAGDNSVTGADGQVYTYKTVVIFVTDGVSNYFLDPQRPGFDGGINAPGYKFPPNNVCYSLELARLSETVECQINESAGGPFVYNGKTYDRPITAMVKTAQDLLHANGHEVHVVALSSLPDAGLRYGVASLPSYYAEAQTLEVDPNTGMNNVDLLFQNIYERVDEVPCIPHTNPVTGTIEPEHLPDGFPDGQIGRAYLYDDTMVVYETPITVDATGWMYYYFHQVEPGDYTLRAYVHYRGDDGVVRQYDSFYDYPTDTLTSELPITIDAAIDPTMPPMLTRDLELRLTGGVCSTGE